MTTSAVEAYAAYVEECFQGEVSGEALFRTMVSCCEDADARRKLRVLEQPERETKEVLRPALEDTGRSAHEDPKRIAEGERLGASLAKLPWAELMRVFRTSLERFVEHFERSEKLAVPGKEALLRHVTAHERALLDFAMCEIEGNGTDSLESVLALLRSPAS